MARRSSPLVLSVELEREVDGRWIAEVPELPGVMIYAPNRKDAVMKVKGLALRVIAELIEHGEPLPGRRSAHAIDGVHFRNAAA